MRVLIVNDDGIEAQGIKTLRSIVQSFPDVSITTYAPAANNSGVSHAISVEKRVEVIKINDSTYTVTGTPADCVILALHNSFNIKAGDIPDLIISGINFGINVGCDVTISGTIGAAFEGVISGIPSIAISQYFFRSRDVDWPKTTEIITDILKNILEKKLYSTEYVLNINLPKDLDNLKGIKIVDHGKHHGRFNTARRINDHAFLMGEDLLTREDIAIEGEKDVYYIDQNYVTISPISIDLTHHKALEDLQNRF